MPIRAPSRHELASEVAPERAVEDSRYPDQTPSDMATPDRRSILDVMDRTIASTLPILTTVVSFEYTIPMAANADNTELRITGSETADDTVPVDVLVRVLEGLQQTALIIAATINQRTVERRFRPSEQLRQRCRLRCGPLTHSNSVAVRIGFDPGEPVLFPDPPDERLMGRLLRFAGALARNDTESLNKIIPDARLRALAFRKALNYLPQVGQRWGLELWNGGATPIRLGLEARHSIDEWFRESAEEEMVVTGQLVRIDFETNKVVVRHPTTRNLLHCNYEIDAEDGLLENRREWVQVHGRFELDRQMNPAKAILVTRIEPLDLSRLTIDRVRDGSQTLRIDPPLELQPRLDDESKQLLVVEDGDIDLLAFAATREELEAEVVAHILLLWNEYANEDRDELTPAAQKLRERLRRRIQGAVHAAT